MPNMRKLIGGLALIAGVSIASLASAQPLNILVTPLTIPGAIIGGIFSPPPAGTYDPAPARAAAIGYTDDLFAIVPAPVLLATGPRYQNPAQYRRSSAVVLRRGSTVPAYVETQQMENVSVAGLVPGGDYRYFVSPQQRVVVLDPASRRVVTIIR